MDQTNTYTENQTIVGYFDSSDRAERALDELKEAGFTSAQLGVAHRGGSAAHKAAHAGESMWDKVKNFFEGSPENYADERTRGDFGTREITDPDTGPSSGYTHDDLHHSLTGMDVPEDRSRYLSQRFGSSDQGCVLTVKAGARVAEAERILRDNGADLGENAGASTDYTTPAATAGYPAGSNYDQAPRSQYNSPEYNAPESTSESARESTGSYDGTASREAAYDDRNSNRGQQDVQNIQLLGEVLRVHKDRVNRGEVVIRKDIITETQNVQVPVTREELVVERRDVSGETPARGSIGENQELRIPLSEETASVDKGTVVREEVAVGKRPVQEVRDLSGEVRREELVVDDQTRKRAVNE